MASHWCLKEEEGERRRRGSGGIAGHKRSDSMDDPTSPFEGKSELSCVLPDYTKKAVPTERLVELALLDPKWAKRWEERIRSEEGERRERERRQMVKVVLLRESVER
jgi:transcription factor VIP1